MEDYPEKHESVTDDPYAEDEAVTPYMPGTEEERDWLQGLTDEQLLALPRTLAVECELDERPDIER